MELAELPSIIQAVQATPRKDHDSPHVVHALPVPFPANLPATQNKDEDNHMDSPPPKLETNTAASSPQTPPVNSRCTRSQAAPDWTTYETLVLVSEIAAVDEDWLKALSSYQKWKIIAENCAASDVVRPSNQCKRRWELLLADYRKIREWEERNGEGAFWNMGGNRRKELGLPPSFDHDVFDSMDAVIKPQEARAQEARARRVESGPEDTIFTAGGFEEPVRTTEMAMLDVSDNALGCKENVKVDADKAREMSCKLQENAKKIHAILRGELENNTQGPMDSNKPSWLQIEFSRRQADELIKVIGGLAGSLNQLTEMIRAGECDGIRPVDSMT